MIIGFGELFNASIVPSSFVRTDRGGRVLEDEHVKRGFVKANVVGILTRC